MSTQLIELLAEADSGTPLYLKVANTLSGAIRAGRWQASQALPSERKLADLLSISRVTARKAIKVLCERGVMTRKPGSGNYILPESEQRRAQPGDFSAQLRQRGYTPGSHWLSREIGTATPQEALALGLSPAAMVARLRRLRTADGIVMAIESTTLPLRHLPDPNAVGDSLYAYLRAHALHPARAMRSIAAVNATDEQARLAHIAPGTAMLFITRVAYPETGNAIELTHCYCLSDYYECAEELRC